MLLPELHSLQRVVERNDWHKDTVLEQSTRLSLWVDELPASLPAYLSGNVTGLQDILPSPVDAEHGHHSLKDVLKFTALIHDVGKGATLEVAADGTTRCPEHESVGARLVPAICDRFDFTPAETQLITTLVEFHGEPYATFKRIGNLPVRLQGEQIRSFLDGHAAHLLPLLILASGDLVTSQLQDYDPRKYDDVLGFYGHLLRTALHRARGSP